MEPPDPHRTWFEDPREPRRRGRHRVRVVTASLAGAAVVGTGALVVVVADEHPAAASTGATTTDDGTTSTGTTSTGTTEGYGDDDATRPALSGGFDVPPSTGLGQAPAGGGSHASSGGS